MIKFIFGIATFCAFGLVTHLASAETFGGNDCTEDCSGHKAGYEWAEQNGVSDESECGGNPNSFQEGCQTYIQYPSRGADEDDDGNDIE